MPPKEDSAMKKTGEENILFSRTEFEELIGDISKIARSFEDGHTCGFSELKSVLSALYEKHWNTKKYSQIVFD